MAIRQLERNQTYRIVTIREVNMEQHYIEAEDAYGTPIHIDTTALPPYFQVPAVGEIWTVDRRGSDWILGHKYEDQTAQISVAQLQPGDVRQEATGTFYITSKKISTGYYGEAVYGAAVYTGDDIVLTGNSKIDGNLNVTGTITGNFSVSSSPTAPTAPVDTNTTQIATTAFVLGQAGAATPNTVPSSAGAAAVGTSLRYARQDHTHKLAAGTIVDADVNTSAGIEFYKMNWHLSATPPGSPVDNMGWIYNGASGIFWYFIYDSTESTYKWKFIGGPWLEAVVSTDQTFTDNSTLQDPATVGPTVTLPFAGDYETFQTANMYYSGAGAGVANAMGNPLTASSGTWDTTGTTGSNSSQILSINGIGITVANMDTIRGVSASATLKMQYSATADATGTSHTRHRITRARPIRVI